jgi:hypothetical protein
MIIIIDLQTLFLVYRIHFRFILHVELGLESFDFPRERLVFESETLHFDVGRLELNLCFLNYTLQSSLAPICKIFAD